MLELLYLVKVTLTLCEKRPRHVKREAMFLLNQGVSNIPHPYDISADDGLGLSIKRLCQILGSDIWKQLF